MKQKALFSKIKSNILTDIKNAKKAKEGQVSAEEIGIYPLDDKTLVIELEHPCTYFLEILCNPLFSPVNHRIDRLYPNWPLQTGKDYVCNGPFYLENLNTSRDAYVLKKSKN